MKIEATAEFISYATIEVEVPDGLSNEEIDLWLADNFPWRDLEAEERTEAELHSVFLTNEDYTYETAWDA